MVDLGKDYFIEYVYAKEIFDPNIINTRETAKYHPVRYCTSFFF